MLSTLDAARRDKSRQKTTAAFCLWRADKFQMIFNSHFITSSAGRLKLLRRGASGVDTEVLIYREERKQPCHLIAGLPLLEFSPALESWSDIYTGPTSCLIIPQTFSAFVFYPPSLSFCRSARLFTERSLLHIMSRHAPYCWLAASLFWYCAPTQFCNAFLKNYIPHL